MSEILDFNKASLKEVKNSLAEWCQVLRKENNETQISLAQKLNVSHKTIYNLEKGSNFTIDILLKVLQYFDRLDLFYRFLSDQIAQEKDKKDISFY